MDDITVYTAGVYRDGELCGYRMALHPLDTDKDWSDLRRNVNGFMFPFRVAWVRTHRDDPFIGERDWRASCLSPDCDTYSHGCIDFRRFDTEADAIAWLLEGEPG